MQIYIVRAGDTPYSVAARFGISPALLFSLNGLSERSVLVVGQALLIRYPSETHTVRAGETVYSIARRYGLSPRQLYQNNFFLGGQSALAVGDELVIAYEGEPLRTIDVNAYAYPFIAAPLLRAALPYLTYLTPFTYGVGEGGALLPLADEALLSAAGQYRAAGMMHLSTLTESGGFDNARSTLVLEDAAAQDALVQGVLQALRDRGYVGLDVDFEYVLPRQREAYAAFITRLRETLNPLGCPVVVALAPKTSAAQPGLLYEAHDYALLGAAANAVLLMTYEWGYAYGPPMAVAPLGEVRAVLDYAVTEIAPEKIFLGVPLYGYDWTLPFAQGETRAESLSPAQAVERAARYGAEILYDEASQAPYYFYTDREGKAHAVWFEDARSLAAKLRLADEYALNGVGCWSLMRDFPQGWNTLAALYDIDVML